MQNMRTAILISQLAPLIHPPAFSAAEALLRGMPPPPGYGRVRQTPTRPRSSLRRYNDRGSDIDSDNLFADFFSDNVEEGGAADP